MDWLHPFIAFALCCGAVTTLLPEGGLRRTAALVIGLMLTLCWAQCLGTLLGYTAPEAPAFALSETGYSYEAALADYASTLGGD